MAHCGVQFKQEDYEQLQPVDSQQGHCCSQSINSPHFQLEDSLHLLSTIATL